MQERIFFEKALDCYVSLWFIIISEVRKCTSKLKFSLGGTINAEDMNEVKVIEIMIKNLNGVLNISSMRNPPFRAFILTR